MPDLYTLFAKIQSLPKRRIAEVEDFVDFLALRRVSKVAKPLSPEEEMHRLNKINRAKYGDQPLSASPRARPIG